MCIRDSGVDACRPAGHPPGVRRAAELPGPARLRSAGPAGAPQPDRLRGLPARIPGAVLDGVPCRVRAAPLRGASALEVNRLFAVERGGALRLTRRCSPGPCLVSRVVNDFLVVV